MRIIHVLAGSAALAFALPAAAQTPQAGAQTPPAAGQARPGRAAQYTRVSGEVIAITDKEMTVRAADGKTTTFSVGRVMIPRVIPSSTIKAGDFVATTNITVDENSGRATELRVLPPPDAGRAGQGESYPMGGQAGRSMTNAPVAKVVDTPEGRVLTTRIPGGERRIILPDTVKVIGYTVVDKAAIKPGWHVQAILNPGPDGKLVPVQILTGENGAAPPAR